MYVFTTSPNKLHLVLHIYLYLYCLLFNIFESTSCIRVHLIIVINFKMEEKNENNIF